MSRGDIFKLISDVINQNKPERQGNIKFRLYSHGSIMNKSSIIGVEVRDGLSVEGVKLFIDIADGKSILLRLNRADAIDLGTALIDTAIDHD